ncbi:DUF5801 repeats-in-toxin domain-containing protein, partial [Halomonas fontilapidosi]
DETDAVTPGGFPISDTSDTAILTLDTIDFGADGAAASNDTVYGLELSGDGTTSLATAQGDYPISLVETNATTLTGQYVDGAGVTQTAFTVAINANGTLTVTQETALEHQDPNDDNDTLDLSGLITATVEVTDADGDTDSDSVEIGGAVTFIDDGPTISAADDSTTFNYQGYAATGQLNFNAGADDLGELVFRGFVNGNQGVLSDGTLMTAGGQPVYWFGEGTDTLDGRLDDQNGDMVFSASLNDDGSYTFTTYESIDSVSTFEVIDIGSLGISGGNAGGFVVGSSTPDDDFDDILITAVQPGGTVNTSADDIGTGNQWVDSSDGVRFEFVTNIQADATFDEHRLVTGANVSLASVKGGDTQTDVLLAIYDQGGTNTLLTSEQEVLDTVSAIRYTSGSTSITLNGAGEIETAFDNGVIGFAQDYSANGTLVSGLVVYGVDEATSVGITASTAFDTIDIVNFDAPSFSINGIDGAAITNEPVDVGLSYAVIDGDGDESDSEEFNITLNPVIEGTIGNDTLLGTEFDELIIGGAGDDDLTGGLGADTFAWNLSDKGTSTEPANDTVMDFTLGVFGTNADADKLDLSDLLQDADFATENINEYIVAETSGNDTILHIKHDGNISGDGSDADQAILMKGVDMGGDTSPAFIQSLIDDGQLDIE